MKPNCFIPASRIREKSACVDMPEVVLENLPVESALSWELESSVWKGHQTRGYRTRQCFRFSSNITAPSASNSSLLFISSTTPLLTRPLT